MTQNWMNIDIFFVVSAVTVKVIPIDAPVFRDSWHCLRQGSSEFNGIYIASLHVAYTESPSHQFPEKRALCLFCILSWYPFRDKMKCILLKDDGNRISLQERDCKETTYPKNDKYVSRSY